VSRLKILISGQVTGCGIDSIFMQSCYQCQRALSRSGELVSKACASSEWNCARGSRGSGADVRGRLIFKSTPRRRHAYVHPWRRRDASCLSSKSQNTGPSVRQPDGDGGGGGNGVDRSGVAPSATVADLAHELSMKINSELSGSEGISRLGRSPSLNAAHVDAIELVDRRWTARRHPRIVR